MDCRPTTTAAATTSSMTRILQWPTVCAPQIHPFHWPGKSLPSSSFSPSRIRSRPQLVGRSRGIRGYTKCAAVAPRYTHHNVILGRSFILIWNPWTIKATSPIERAKGCGVLDSGREPFIGWW